MSTSSQNINELTFNQLFKSLTIIHFALFLGSFLVIVITRFVKGFDTIDFQNLNFQYAILGLLAMISFIFIGKKVATTMKNNISPSEPLEKKIMKFQSSKLIELMSVEMPIILVTIIGFAMNEFSLTIVAALTLFYLWSLKPSRSEFVEKIPLSGNERTYFEGNMSLGDWKNSVLNQ